MADEQFSQYTRLPTEHEKEDPFLPLGAIALSLRQTLTILIGAGLWFFAWKFTTAIIPISGLFSGLLWSWLLIGGLVLALVPRDGVTFEEYLTRRLVFMLSERRWIFIEKRDRRNLPDVDEADWEEDDDFDLPHL